MGCGKTTFGKKLANYLKIDFIDLDHEIERNTNSSITELFNSIGELEFRKLETKFISDLLYVKKNIVISLGGGTVCFNDNIKLIKDNTTLIYLKMSNQALFSRLINSKTNRPMIKNLNDTELLKFIENKMSERELYYKQAHHTVNALNIKINDVASFF